MVCASGTIPQGPPHHPCLPERGGHRLVVRAIPSMGAAGDEHRDRPRQASAGEKVGAGRDHPHGRAHLVEVREPRLLRIEPRGEERPRLERQRRRAPPDGDAAAVSMPSAPRLAPSPITGPVSTLRRDRRQHHLRDVIGVVRVGGVPGVAQAARRVEQGHPDREGLERASRSPRESRLRRARPCRSRRGRPAAARGSPTESPSGAQRWTGTGCSRRSAGVSTLAHRPVRMGPATTAGSR